MSDEKLCSLRFEDPQLCRIVHFAKGWCKYHYEKDYNSRNKGRLNEYKKKYIKTPKAKSRLSAYRKRYMSDPSNRARVNAKNAKSKKRHFFGVRAYMFNWRYESFLTARDLASLWKSQKGCCALTGEKLNKDNAHLDHRIPRSQGGPTDLTNLRWLHETVNHAKWTFTDEQFIEFCRKVVNHAVKS